MTDLIGQTIGQYLIIEEIGRGGMATVYRGFQARIGRDVAIKVLPAQFTHDPTFLARFTREVEIAARLQHHRILPVYDYGEYEGQPYIVMAYMPGGNLEERIAEGALPPADALPLVEQIAEGLDYLHAGGIIHRDFKPSNVLLDASGSAFLSDFGIARVQEATAHLTGTGILGTPAYMAPEMFREGDASPASDIYALGVTLYEMLSGLKPFDAETPVQYMRAHLEKPVPDVRRAIPDLPVAMQRVIATALAKDPAQRYQSAGELASALRGAVHPTPQKAAARKQSSIPIWPLAALVGVIVLAIIAAGVFFALRGGQGVQIEPTALAVAAAPTITVTPTDIPSSATTPTPFSAAVPIIGGGTGRIGFNWNGMGYIVDASCVVAGGGSAGCDPNPNILPSFSGLTPYFGQWSPDGKKILFVKSPDTGGAALESALQESRIYLVDVETSQLIQIDPEHGTYNPVFSPDATRLAYLSPGAIISLVDLDCGSQSGEVCTLTGMPIFDYSGPYAIQPGLIAGWLTEDHLIVQNPEPVNMNSGGFGLYTMRLDGSGFEYYANQLGWQVSDTDFILTREGDHSGSTSILRATEQTTGKTWPILRINPKNFIYWNFDWLWNGRYLVFRQDTDRFDPGELFVVDVLSCIEDGYMGCQESMVQITDNEVGEADGAFSPDGQWLAFVRSQRAEVQAVNQCGWHYEVNPAEYRCDEVDALVNLEGDIYILNIAQAISGAGEAAVIRVTNLGFAGWGRTDQFDDFNLSWQPAAAP